MARGPAEHPSLESMVHPLSDRLLRSWLRCRRKAWLDRHGDPAERLWNPHRALQLPADRERRLQQCINQPLERCTGLGALQRGEPAVRLLLLRRDGMRPAHLVAAQTAAQPAGQLQLPTRAVAAGAPRHPGASPHLGPLGLAAGAGAGHRGQPGLAAQSPRTARTAEPAQRAEPPKCKRHSRGCSRTSNAATRHH